MLACRTGLLLACLAVLQWAQPALAAGSVLPGFSAERFDRIDALLEREIAEGRLSGMVVAVARHGKVMQRNYGYMSLETREKMRGDALFRLYSMTKPIASVALLTLYEQAMACFDLNGSARQVHPAVRDLKVYAGKDATANRFSSPRRKAHHPVTPFDTTLGYPRTGQLGWSMPFIARWGSP